jgi:Spx/MgsR family transcriptional regulator
MSSEHRNHLHVYGIRNCDTCRSTLKWLQTRNVPHTFHDFRLDGLPEALLKTWLASSHASYLVNRRSTTWRQLADSEKQAVDAARETDVLALLLTHPTLIKRPVITDGRTILDIGFSPSNLDDYI